MSGLEKVNSAPAAAPLPLPEKPQIAPERAAVLGEQREASRDLSAQIEEKQLREAEARIDASDKPPTVTDKPAAAPKKSVLDKTIDGISKGVTFVTGAVTPLFQKMASLWSDVKQRLNASFGPMLSPLRAFGVDVPEWLAQAPGGFIEWEQFLEKANRRLVASNDDTKQLRLLEALYAECGGGAAGATYTLEQFMRECIARLSPEKNDVTLNDIRLCAEVVRKEKKRPAADAPAAPANPPASSPA